MRAKQDHSEVNWHLAQYKPNCAVIAKRNLSRQGFTVFLPLETRTRASANNFVAETKPLFPGYLFVGASSKSDSVHSVHSTYGVSQLVRFGTKAAKVPADLVMELISHCDSDGIMRQNGILEKGDQVRVTHGPFANLVGEVARAAPDRRVWLLLDVIGQKTKVSVARSALQAEA